MPGELQLHLLHLLPSHGHPVPPVLLPTDRAQDCSNNTSGCSLALDGEEQQAVMVTSVNQTTEIAAGEHDLTLLLVGGGGSHGGGGSGYLQ